MRRDDLFGASSDAAEEMRDEARDAEIDRLLLEQHRQLALFRDTPLPDDAPDVVRELWQELQGAGLMGQAHVAARKQSELGQSVMAEPINAQKEELAATTLRQYEARPVTTEVTWENPIELCVRI